MTNGAHSAAGVATYRTMRELGARSPRSYAAIREPNELVVTYRYARAGDAKVSSNVATYVGNDGAITLGSDTMASLVRDAKCLQKNWHPNIARIRHVDLAADELIVASELVDGATLQDLFTFAAARRPAGAPGGGGEPFLPLPVVVRILVDVLAGLHGLHGLRDAASGTLGTIHGALCPANILVGKDGVARIINVLRPRPVQVGASSGAVGYGAPEALDVGGTSDLRADVHGAGVILWEALAGRRLYEDADPVRVLARQREEEIEPPAFPPDSPFAGLAEVVLHALAFDPSLRFKTAAEMGAALRAIAGSRIATGSVVAAQVAELAGERIRARRIELDPSSSGMRRRASLAPMGAAPAVAAETPAPAPEVMMPRAAAASSGYDAPGPMSKRATVPPAALAELDSLSARQAPAEDEAPPASVREELSLRDLMAAAPPLHESAMVVNTPLPGAAAIPAAPSAPATTPAVLPHAGSVPRIALGARPALGTGNTPRPAPAKRVPNPTAPAARPVARSMPPKPPPPMSKRPPPPAAPATANAEPPHGADDNAPTLLREPQPAEEHDPTVVVAAAAASKRSPETEPVDDDPATLQATAVMPVATAPEMHEFEDPPVDNTVKLAAPTAPAQAAEALLPPVAAPEWKRTPNMTFAPVTDEAVAASSSDDGPMGILSAPPPPPLRKMSPAILAGVAVLALIGAVLALRALLGGTPTPAPPPTTAATERPSADVPSPVVTAPPTATEATSAEPTAEANARDEAAAKAKAEAEAEAEAKAKARDEAAAKPSEPTTAVTMTPAPQGGTPPPARPMSPRPTPPGRPKKPYEPSGI